MNNPFTITFGKEPEILINRDYQLAEIEENFTSEHSPTNVYMLTGVRGSGKTVALGNIYNSFKNKKDWICVDLNSSGDILNELAATLYSIPSMHKLFVKAGIDLSLFGIGVSLNTDAQIHSISVAIERMLEEIKKQKKRVLICLDEATNTKEMKMFVSEFQILSRHNLPLYLIMTGLYQNIDALQNDDALTFLYRAPKINLNKLSTSAIVNSYSEIFKCSKEKSKEMAELTMGYPFAYQTLGYLCCKRNTIDLNKIIPEFDQNLEDYVYQKIWTELTDNEREIVKAIAKGKTLIKDIREYTKMTSNKLSVYRDRLNKKGIIDVSDYGKIKFSLPRFGEIVGNYI